MQGETIAAIATPVAPGGIGIVRISGEKAIHTAQKIFVPSGNRMLSMLSGYQAVYGYAQTLEGDRIDEGIALVFRLPKSYTGEDVVEISCHGGLLIMENVLQQALRAGARIAEAGEFTKRAFLNGKLDLTAAESVMELISAKGELSLRAAEARKNGVVFRRVRKIRAELVSLGSHAAAWIDFPEEDVDALENGRMLEKLMDCSNELKLLLQSYAAGRTLEEGILVAIVGKPNAGKSTLMNALVGFEKSIVTEVPGTTRDIVEQAIRMKGIPIRLCDTAGIRETGERVEQLGIIRAKERIAEADLILALFDNNSPLTQEDHWLIENLAGKKVIAVVNKTDLETRTELAFIQKNFADTIFLSAKEGRGMEALENAVKKRFTLEEETADAGMLANARQFACCENALREVQEALEGIRQGITMDAVAVCIESAIAALGVLTGEKASESVISEVFSKFCVGK